MIIIIAIHSSVNCRYRQELYYDLPQKNKSRRSSERLCSAVRFFGSALDGSNHYALDEILLQERIDAHYRQYDDQHCCYAYAVWLDIGFEEIHILSLC